MDHAHRPDLERFWHGTPAEHRVRRAVAELAKVLARAHTEGGTEGVRRRWGEPVGSAPHR